MEAEAHKIFLAEISGRRLNEAEIVERVRTYAGNATFRQLQELTKAAAEFTPDGNGPFRRAIRALQPANPNKGRQGPAHPS